MERPQPARSEGFPVFPTACWLLGLMAFAQLWIGGMALAARYEESKQTRVVEKEVIRHVMVPVPASRPVDSSVGAVVSRPPASAPPREATEPLPAPRPLDTPIIADPRCEQLVREARQARVAGDMVRAVVKLEEALGQAPGEAAVLYELGLVHEQMGVFDRASEFYQKVFELGTSGAGSYYPLAATKLRDGIESSTDNLGKLSLGRVRIFRHPDKSKGERVILTIPVQKAPDFELNLDDLSVSVVFFNRTSKREIIQLEDPSWVEERWVSLPFDWTGGEELLRMTYTVPPQSVQTEHLFGTREYYGQVVSLSYKGEILDVQAWPRDLAARLPGSPSAPRDPGMSPEFQNTLPPDFDPDLGVLPPLPE